MRIPHGEEAHLRRLEPWGAHVAYPSRRGEDAAPQDEVGGRLACAPMMG